MGNKHNRLKPEVLDDLRRHTGFNNKEILEWNEKFLSVFPSGHLSIEKFKETYVNFFSHGDASKFAEHVFRAFDLNGDGILDFREFLIALYLTCYGRINQKLKVTFSLYDIDGNGYISCDELQEVLGSIHRALGIVQRPIYESFLQRRTAILFNQLDRNIDGNISLEEFIEGVMRDPYMFTLLRSNPLLLH